MGPKERMRIIRMIAKAEKNPEMTSRLGIEINSKINGGKKYEKNSNSK